MGDFTHSTTKICNRCQFLPGPKNFLKFLCILYGFVSTHILNLGTNNFSKIEKIFWKTGFNPIFRNCYLVLKKKLRPNQKPECLQTLMICTKKFKKFFGQGKNWQRLQNHNFHQLQQIFVVAGWNHPYMYING